MKRVLAAVLLMAALIPAPAAAVTGEVLQKFATPGPCPTGLAFDGTSLWLADRQTDLLYRIDPKDGKVLGTLPSPGFQAEGLACEGKYLWVLDAEDEKLCKLNPDTGITERTVRLHLSSPQGLAFDGKHLWVGDLKTDRLYQVSTDDGTTITDVPSPAGDPHGLAFDGKYLWVADRTEDTIYMVRPEEGWAILAFDAPGKFARGLAFDGHSLWNVDYQSDAIYRLVLRDDVKRVCTEPKRERLQYVHQFRNLGPGVITSLDIYLAVPHDLPTQKLLGSVKFDPEPDALVTDKWGQRVARFHRENVPGDEFVTATMTVEVELSKIRYFIYPEKVGTLDDIPAEIKDRYLADDTKYAVNDPYMQETARRVVGSERNCYWIAKRLFEYVTERIHYELAGGWNVAPTVLKRGSGSCSEYSFVYIALCRAAGLPARYVGSVVIRGDDASTDNGLFHRWPEVYLPGYGWVPVDPSASGGPKTPAEKVAAFGFRNSRYLITTQGGGGSEYLEWEYNSNALWQSKGPVKVETERYGEWSPLTEGKTAKRQNGPAKDD